MHCSFVVTCHFFSTSFLWCSHSAVNTFPADYLSFTFLTIYHSLHYPPLVLSVSFSSPSFTLYSLVPSPFSHFLSIIFSPLCSLSPFHALSHFLLGSFALYLFSLVLVNCYVYIFAFFSPCRTHVHGVPSFLFLTHTHTHTHIQNMYKYKKHMQSCTLFALMLKCTHILHRYMHTPENTHTHIYTHIYI